MTTSDLLSRDAETRTRIDAAPDPLAMLGRIAAHDDAKPAMIHWRAPDDPAPVAWSYLRTLDAVGRLADALRARGVTTADTVAIIAPSIPETMIALLAAASVAVAFPINLLLSADAIAAQLGLAEAKAVVTFGRHAAFDLRERVAAAIAATPCVRFVVEIDSGSPAQPTTIETVSFAQLLAEGKPGAGAIGPARRAAALFHTGGTAGAPKLAELSLAGLGAAAHMAAAALELRASDRMVQLLPYFHVGGAITVGLSTLSVGATLITCGLTGGRNPELIKAIWSTAAAMEASLLCMVPSTWSLVALLPAPSPWAALRALGTGATAISPDLVARLEALSGVPMFQVYGMSETSGIISAQPADGRFRAPGVGFPVPLQEVRLAPIAEGGPGEVMVRGPNLFRGYRTRDGLVDGPERGLEDSLGDGWVASGDLGALGTDGQLRLAGRRKDVIVRSGHNIDPLSIEDIACAHPGVLAAAAVGMPDAYAGELPVLYVVRRPGANDDEGALQAFLSARIAEPPALPRRLFFLAELPMTPVGKIARYRLRQQAAALRAAEELADLSPLGVDCTDLGARLVTIRWQAASAVGLRAEAETRLTRLGLRAAHDGDDSPQTGRTAKANPLSFGPFRQ